jgi:hypothetical protein
MTRLRGRSPFGEAEGPRIHHLRNKIFEDGLPGKPGNDED